MLVGLCRKFAALYSSGGVPCRIEHHGASKHDLKWDRDFEELDYATLLPACADGMRETAHPYTFIARTGFQQLLAYEVSCVLCARSALTARPPDSPRHQRAGAKAKPVLPQVAVGLRMSFADKDAGVFTACLAALRQLSAAVGPALNPHLKALLGQLARKALDPKLRDDVTLTLQQLEENGGPEAFAVIKSKVPTYTTVCL